MSEDDDLEFEFDETPRLVKDVSELLHPQSRQLFEFWESKIEGQPGQDGRSPISSLLGIPELVPWCYCVTKGIGSTPDMVRFMGSEIIRRLSLDFSGQPMQNAQAEAPRSFGLVTYALESQSPWGLGPIRSHLDNKRYIVSEHFAIPVLDTDDTAIAVVGLVSIFDK